MIFPSHDALYLGNRHVNTTILVNLPDPDQLHYRILVKGILAEVERRGSVSVFVTPYLSPNHIKKIHKGEIHGLITHGGYPDGPPGLLGCVPMVGICHPLALGKLNRVLQDPEATARRALNHFRAEGIEEFGVFHSMDPQDPEGCIRAEAFAKLLALQGLDCHAFPNGPRTAVKWSMPDQLEDLGDWLETLPKLCGIFCGDDPHGQRVLEAAQARGLEVPGEIAVLGFGNDELYCEISRPKLSSVDPNLDTIGGECVARLMEELDGTPRGEQVTWLDCARVVRRDSTDRRYHDYPLVWRAVLLLEHDMPSVGSARELADQLHTSHTTLNQQFRAATGQSTWSFVKARRLEKAQELLRNTDLALAEICAETGIGTLSQLSTDIRKTTGKSPREIRAEPGFPT